MADTGERGGIRQRIVDDYAGNKLYDERGEKIGKVEYTVLDTDGKPEYLAVKTGWFGSNTTLIPESLLRPGDRDDEFEVQASGDRIKDAPTFDNEDDVNRDFEDRVRDYFGLGLTAGTAGSSSASSETSDRERDTGYSDESRERGESRSDRDTRDDRSRDAAAAGGAAGAAGGGMDRDTDRGERRDDERREERGSSGSRSGGERERVRVTVKRERARAERVVGEDGKEEVRIRKEMVEEEEMVEVEDRL